MEHIHMIVIAIILISMLALATFYLLRTRKLSRELGNLVAERTKELELQTQAAQSASKSKSAFIANMSHEIRTPMNAIIGMTNIGKSSAEVERMIYCFDKIEDASKQLLGIINEVLDISKIEAGKFDLSPIEFNFEKMLQRVVNIISYRTDERQQKLTVYIDRSIPKNLIGDDIRIAQVITNLLGNAVKFTPERGFIRIGTQYLGEEKGMCTIQISVTDTGIGISPEQQARLFQPYRQSDVSTARKFGGTGLGLSISRSIVEMMGGKIWIESEIGAGSKFAFTIQVNKGSVEKEKQINWSAVRILAVDSDPYVLSHFEVMARSFGFHCDVAESYDDALELANENEAYNYCFVNWKLQGVEGLKLAKALKWQNPETVAIIMASASKWSEMEEEARKGGIDKFLTKPLFPSAVADVVNECFGEPHEHETDQADITGIFSGRRILLAEDVEINREIVLALLSPTLLEIECAENGAEALRLFGNAPAKYDAIFMDVQMPIMDGLEATEKIRNLNIPRAKTIPIIAMTANVFQEDIDRCLESGMDNHVGKPLDFEQVIEQLKRYLLE